MNPSATAGDGSATVTVPANATDRRYGAPSSYTVTAVGDPARACTVTPPSTSCQVTGLSNGTAYTFTARANLNTWQTGASNASFPATTPAAGVMERDAAALRSRLGSLQRGIDRGRSSLARRGQDPTEPDRGWG